MKTLLLTLVAALLLPLPALAQDFPVTVQDGLGRSVTLPAPAERVVATDEWAVYDLLAMGFEPVGGMVAPSPPQLADETAAEAVFRLRGVTVDPAFQRVNRSDWSIDYELVAALDPDLIVGVYAEDIPVAEQIAPSFNTTIQDADGRDHLDRVAAQFLAVAALVGRTEAAEALVAQVQNRMAAYERLAPGDRTVMLLSTDGVSEMAVLGRGNLSCQLWDQVGGCATEGPDNTRWTTMTVEGILSIDPDVILILPPCFGGDCEGPNGEALAALDAQPLWGELSAVQNGRVHVLPYDVRAFTISSLAGFFDTTLPLIYPETFPTPLTDDQVQEILASEN